MTDHGLELRLRSLYDAEATGAPNELRDRVIAVPVATGARAGAIPGRPRVLALLVAALLLAALVIGGGVLAASGRLELPWQIRPALVHAADVDVCAVISAAVARTRSEEPIGQGQGPGAFAGWRFDHDGELTAWGAKVCAYGYDGGWNHPHLLLLPETTSLSQAEPLLDTIFPERRAAWARLAPGQWSATATDRSAGFAAVAVSADPYFFVVTSDTMARARALGSAVLAELGDPPSGR